MILNARVGYPGVRSGIIIASLFLAIAGCSSTVQLSEAERQKLDPQLTMLLRGDAVADLDFDVGLRKGGIKEYAVIIRSTNVEEIKAAGIQVGSAFSDVITARVTIPELKKILSLASVRAVQNGTKSYPQ